ncbi:23S rRNA (adenine(2030)-N(6))-methyltransferase RlmJ [Enterovirga aerilata]|uniref:Ribosomal RNA large subunit methyltransferase J n=1 Tax=Enterovirga aerilata TaxID=2730920 RepID=A0A849I7Y5_9HYPH|nr:23S rRNA (adenine(2030)-N(6))-methyltransferase RlmJ [Enterovirga sp. DB1703]NNM73498.1 23S rRNA (adenine(2030)-N(6))-methyltransferase RlmJ [Enterovirga sp. DB1703]
MNYRHAFHAGNFADVMKHALLARILVHLRGKETPFRVVDTHAGIGRYDLAGPQAERTLEWRAGIGRMEEPFGPEVEPLLAPYREVIGATRARYGETVYPGSPAIVRELLRPADRAVFVEKHPEDGAVLAERFNAVHNIKVMLMDGWIALRGLIPPKERRGLVLIDPPFEEPGELARAASRLRDAMRRWPTGIFAVWYPIKDMAEIESFVAAASGAQARDLLRLELLVDRPDGLRLAGSGLLVANPPWTLAGEAGLLLPALAERLARRDYGAFRCERLEREPPRETRGPHVPGGS